MRTPLVLHLLAVVFLWSCVSGGTREDSGEKYDRYRISPEEIQGQPPDNAYQIVMRLRPDWLRGRAPTLRSNTGRYTPTVFVDQRPYGELYSLRQLSSVDIAEIHFITSSDATTRFGTGYPAGIINVILKR